MTWQQLQLGDVVRLKRGHDLPASERLPGDVPIVSSSGVTGFHNVAKVAGPGVVTGRYGTLGEVHYIEEDYWPLNTALYVDDFKGSHPRFVAYLLKTLDLGNQNAAGAVPGLNRNALHQIRVTIPVLDVQRRIARVLEAYDDLIGTNQRRIALLEDAARRLYREWFVHLRFLGQESLPITAGVPQGWQFGPLGNLIKTSSGGTPSRKNPEFFGSGTPWVKTQELNDSFLSETEEEITAAGLASSSAKVFPSGTVLLAMYGATIGMTAILATPAATNQACCAFLVADIPGLTYYCFLWLREIKQRLIALGIGAAQPNLSQEVIRAIEFLMPPASVLEMYDAAVAPLFDQIATLLQLNRELARSRDLLLPKLMSGKLDVSSIRLPEEATA